jgi:hypothetical protein
MKNIAENNLIRFINISKKKNGLYANFKAKGIRGGTVFTASVCVDITSVDVDLSSDSSGCSAAWLAHLHGVQGDGGSNPLTQILFLLWSNPHIVSNHKLVTFSYQACHYPNL